MIIKVDFSRIKYKLTKIEKLIELFVVHRDAYFRLEQVMNERDKLLELRTEYTENIHNLIEDLRGKK